MNRTQLAASIAEDLQNIGEIFARKNGAYGQNQDALYNFTKGAELLFGEANFDTKFKTLFAYASKHIAALTQPEAIYKDPEFAERCLDIAVYMLIARAMRKGVEEENPYVKTLRLQSANKDKKEIDNYGK